MATPATTAHAAAPVCPWCAAPRHEHVRGFDFTLYACGSWVQDSFESGPRRVRTVRCYADQVERLRRRLIEAGLNPD